MGDFSSAWEYDAMIIMKQKSPDDNSLAPPLLPYIHVYQPWHWWCVCVCVLSKEVLLCTSILQSGFGLHPIAERWWRLHSTTAAAAAAQTQFARGASEVQCWGQIAKPRQVSPSTRDSPNPAYSLCSCPYIYDECGTWGAEHYVCLAAFCVMF